MNQENYYKLVKLYATANIMLELMTEMDGTGLYKQELKRNTNNYQLFLERTTNKYICKMYEDEEGIYTAIQKAIQKILQEDLVTLANKGIED